MSTDREVAESNECFCGTELEAGLCPNGHDPMRIWLTRRDISPNRRVGVGYYFFEPLGLSDDVEYVSLDVHNAAITTARAEQAERDAMIAESKLWVEATAVTASNSSALIVAQRCKDIAAAIRAAAKEGEHGK